MLCINSPGWGGLCIAISELSKKGCFDQVEKIISNHSSLIASKGLLQFFSLVVSSYTSKNFSQAHAESITALRSLPGSPYILSLYFFHLALCSFQVGSAKSAEVFLNQAMSYIQKTPSSWLLWRIKYSLCISRLRSGSTTDYKKDLEELEASLEDMPASCKDRFFLDLIWLYSYFCDGEKCTSLLERQASFLTKNSEQSSRADLISYYFNLKLGDKHESDFPNTHKNQTKHSTITNSLTWAHNENFIDIKKTKATLSLYSQKIDYLHIYLTLDLLLHNCLKKRNYLNYMDLYLYIKSKILNRESILSFVNFKKYDIFFLHYSGNIKKLKPLRKSYLNELKKYEQKKSIEIDKELSAYLSPSQICSVKLNLYEEKIWLGDKSIELKSKKTMSKFFYHLLYRSAFRHFSLHLLQSLKPTK